ncbi:MAG: MMPL family transporter [Thermoplasmata archaeon]|nr:MMPL family transporter [Thermoplasmata archaeon]
MAHSTTTRGERVFAALGRGIVKHPWYPIIGWLLLLLLALPFLGLVASSTTNSTTTLPSAAPSSVAANHIATEFPNATTGSASFLLFLGPNLSAAPTQALVAEVTSRISGDRALQDVAAVSSLYSAYQQYLTGEATAAEQVVGSALSGSTAFGTELNQTSGEFWGPPAAFVATWTGLVSAHPGSAPGGWDYPAYSQTRTTLGSNASALQVLDAFYSGPSNSGFNGSSGCSVSVQLQPACADGVVRVNEATLIPSLAGTGTPALLAGAVLQNLGIENATNASSVRWAGSAFLGQSSGPNAYWLDQFWARFPGGSASPAELSGWSASIVANGTLATYPLPVPRSILSTFLSPDGLAEVVIVQYTVSSSYIADNGSTPVYHDVNELDRLVPPLVEASPAARGLQYYQTGPAALDTQENSDLSSTIALVLPLTIITLIVITILYFRAPLTPIVTFGGLSIALLLGLGAVVLVGHVITKVDTTTLALVTTFVLGVGTDYSIFLLARYREEIYRGVPPEEAIVTTVTWAGQAVATSGTTAVIATLALAFSGIALLSQWGMVLSIAVLVTVLISLTLVPAFLTLLRNRIFWPSVGPRLERHAAEARERIHKERSYYFRAGRLTQRRPKSIIGVVILVSLPLIVLALSLPLSYNFYDQLPGNQPSSVGLAAYNQHFGSGEMFPFQALVVFASPLLQGNTSNISEFTDLAALTSSWTNSSGVAAVDSPVGPDGAPLSAWVTYGAQPAASRGSLTHLLSNFVGVDGRSVLLTVVPTEPGLSYAAVSTFTRLQSDLPGLMATHGTISAVYFSGGAPVTHDLAAQTSQATLRMILLVSVGLLLVLFAVLRTVVIPIFALATILLSISWALALTSLFLTSLLGYPLFFFVPTVMIILILGLGTDYNIFLLTRIREERLRGRANSEAIVHALGHTGGIITAAAIILASAFAILGVGNFTLLRAIGFGVAIAVLLDALVVRTYLVPASLRLMGDRAWGVRPGSPPSASVNSEVGPAESPATS